MYFFVSIVIVVIFSLMATLRDRLDRYPVVDIGVPGNGNRLMHQWHFLLLRKSVESVRRIRSKLVLV